MKKKKNILTAAFVAAFVFSAAAPFAFPEQSVVCEASVVKHKTSGTNSAQKQEIEKLRRNTSFSPDDISSFLQEGFKPDNIRDLYILKNLVSDEFSTIKDAYMDNGKDAKAVLASYGISEDDYEDASKRAFPEDDETDFGRVQRIKNLRHMDF